MKPWITPGIFKSISKRDFYFRKFIKNKHQDMKSRYHESYYRNLIITLAIIANPIISLTTLANIPLIL